MKIKVINGPNLNMLGIREPELYGFMTYSDLVEACKDEGRKLSVDVTVVQSNHEGVLVDEIQDCYHNFHGILINPAAYTHTSVAILDALKAVALPTVEVHISDIDKREEFRKLSYVSMACLETVKGEGIDGYRKGLRILKAAIDKESSL